MVHIQSIGAHLISLEQYKNIYSVDRAKFADSNDI